MQPPLLSLPDVTLVAIDTVAHELAALAMSDCLNRVTFGDVLLFSDKLFLPLSMPPGGIRVIDVPPLRGWEAVYRVWWYEVPKHVHTSHFLTVQWDSWVLNPDAWNPDWLQYDYIGAPWPWHQIYRVGNGGFSLRSRRLHDHLAHHRERYPLAHPEDDALCRRYRPMLEADGGFQWAPESVAQRFSFERGATDSLPFGFHGAFNFPDVMNLADLDSRLAAANDYAMSKIEWAEMLKRRWDKISYHASLCRSPCGECHLRPGEICDICGAIGHAAPSPHRDVLPARRARVPR
jgi:hypothetical protein